MEDLCEWGSDGIAGNEKGDVIVFEPSTSEHVSTCTISDPVTALAPGADCRTYALGYVAAVYLNYPRCGLG